MTDKDNNKLQEAKTKAVKELAERIKVEFYTQFDELIPSVMSDRIDELVEEVLEDGAGEKRRGTIFQRKVKVKGFIP